jgi:dihydroorotase-like cyclic amidohydrolase
VSDETAPYERLAELAEREHALVAAFDLSRIGELVALAQERTRLVAGLPARPPATARPALARAAALQERTTAALVLLRAELGQRLGELDRARRAANGYGMGLRARSCVDHAG